MAMEQKEALNQNGMADKKALLGQYKKTTPKDAGEDMQLPTLVKPKEAYRAFSQTAHPESIKIYDGDGNFDFNSISHIISGSFRDDILTINTSTQSFIITGENLEQVAELVADKKVSALKEFNSERHIKPTEPKAPIIESITISQD